MEENKPLVSVIIPTYNRSIYLTKALDSVFNQTYKNLDVIVVDDGSWGDLNDKLCASYHAVNFLKINNSGGPCKPRNEGIKIAKGSFITFLDDDDVWEVNKIEVLLDILIKNPEFGLSHHYCSLIDGNDKVLNGFVGRPGKIDDKHGSIAMKMTGSYTVSDYPLCRVEVIKKVGFFNENMIAAGEDVEYWNRAAFFTNFYYVDLPLTKYRLHTLNNSEINKSKYVELNLFIKQFLKKFKKKAIISSEDYSTCVQKLVFNQIKIIKLNYFKNLIVIFKLDFFWFLKFRSLKLLLFILLKR